MRLLSLRPAWATQQDPLLSPGKAANAVSSQPRVQEALSCVLAETSLTV
jgi:hypothetical protein